jgi:hypothetical protein
MTKEFLLLTKSVKLVLFKQEFSCALATNAGRFMAPPTTCWERSVLTESRA